MSCLQIDLSDEEVELNCATLSKSIEPMRTHRGNDAIHQGVSNPTLVQENTLNHGQENWDENGETASAIVYRTSESQDRRARRQIEQTVRPSHGQWTVDDYEPLVLRPRTISPELLRPRELHCRNPVETQGLRSKFSARLAPRCVPGTVPRSALPIKLRGVQFSGLTPIDTDPTLNPPPFVCFNCWGKGQNKSWCREARRRFCSNCGRKGVDLTDCPRCKVAHNEYTTQRYGEGWNATVKRKRASPSRQNEDQRAKGTAAGSTETNLHRSVINFEKVGKMGQDWQLKRGMISTLIRNYHEHGTCR
uniref:CCHC-type domain-containing protein n=1 Tax=Trichogramma kaykai TaxID=54128 RepID=A0ABD2VS84_9HYME